MTVIATLAMSAECAFIEILENFASYLWRPSEILQHGDSSSIKTGAKSATASGQDRKQPERLEPAK
jgi:hypothetical protein